MMRRVYPVMGRVHIPGTDTFLTARGCNVEWSTYWQRALDAGEITDAAPEAARKPKKESANERT